MEKQEVPFDEIMHASAVNFLLSDNEKDAAITLLSCTVDLRWADQERYTLYLRGPRPIYTAMKEKNNPIRESIIKAFNAVLPADMCIGDIFPLASLVDVEPNWKEQMLDIAMGKQVHNQGANLARTLATTAFIVGVLAQIERVFSQKKSQTH